MPQRIKPPAFIAVHEHFLPHFISMMEKTHQEMILMVRVLVNLNLKFLLESVSTSKDINIG